MNYYVIVINTDNGKSRLITPPFTSYKSAHLFAEAWRRAGVPADAKVGTIENKCWKEYHNVH